MRALRTVALTQPPGTTYQYCNLNYTILGLIVQTVAGEAYEHYVQEHILAPLRMTNTFMSPDNAREHGLATGHMFWFGRPVRSGADEPLQYNRAAVPEGYISSSAEDMAHYLVALLGGGRYAGAQVLSPAGIAELHRPAAPEGEGDAFYAMGWEVMQINGVPAVSHNGSTTDFHARMILVPEGQWGIVLLTNGENFLQFWRIDGIAAGVMSLFLGRQPPPLEYELFLMILLIGLVAVVFQLLGIVWSVVLLRRWRAEPARRPRGVVGVALRVVLPLALNLVWALVCLVIVPSVLTFPLASLVFGDFGLVMVVSGAVALVWGILRAVLVCFVLRTPGAPKAVKGLVAV